MQELLNSVDATLARYNSGALSTEGVAASPGSTSNSRPPATSTPTSSMDVQTGHDYVIERWDLYCWFLLYCRATSLQVPTRSVRNCLWWSKYDDFLTRILLRNVCSCYLCPFSDYSTSEIFSKVSNSRFFILVICVWGYSWADVLQNPRSKIEKDHSGRTYWGQWSYPLSFCKFPIMLIRYSVKFWLAFHNSVNRAASWLDDTG